MTYSLNIDIIVSFASRYCEKSLTEEAKDGENERKIKENASVQ